MMKVPNVNVSWIQHLHGKRLNLYDSAIRGPVLKLSHQLEFIVKLNTKQ